MALIAYNYPTEIKTSTFVKIKDKERTYFCSYDEFEDVLGVRTVRSIAYEGIIHEAKANYASTGEFCAFINAEHLILKHKCGRRTAYRTMQFLERNGFIEREEIPENDRKARVGHLIKFKIIPLKLTEELIKTLNSATMAQNSATMSVNFPLQSIEKIEENSVFLIPHLYTSNKHLNTSINTYSISAKIEGASNEVKKSVEESSEEEVVKEDGAVNDTGKKTGRAKKVSHDDSVIQNQFQEWYNIYPRHEARQSALKSYQKSVKTITCDKLLELTKLYARKCEGEDHKFIPYPSTWLNQERWKDVENSSSNTNSPSQRRFSYDNLPKEIPTDPRIDEFLDKHQNIGDRGSFKSSKVIEVEGKVCIVNSFAYDRDRMRIHQRYLDDYFHMPVEIISEIYNRN